MLGDMKDFKLRIKQREDNLKTAFTAINAPILINNKPVGVIAGIDGDYLIGYVWDKYINIEYSQDGSISAINIIPY